MISYNKISYLSDAFVDLEDLDCYIDLVTNDNFSSGKLSLDKYTAGTTDNPDDYKLPRLQHILEPKLLSEINVFNSSQTEGILFRSDPSIQEEYPILEQNDVEIPEEESHLYSPDSQDIMKFLEKNFKDLVSRKNYDYSKLQLSTKLNKYVLFELNERYFQTDKKQEENAVQLPNALTDFPKKESSKSKKESNNVEITNNYDNYVTQNELSNIAEYNDYNTENNSTTVYNGKQINYKSNVSNRYKSVRFSIQNITKNYITEIKQEILQQVEEMITTITNKISNENITRIEINNIKNEIINNFETKIETYTKKALDQFEMKTKSEMKDMFKSFLNS
jgi:hypothetical protein